jgi:predicted amidohydrolase YtcJ
MIRRALLLACLVACLCPCGLAAQSAATAAPTLVITGGRVFTAAAATPWAEAIAIRDDRIVAVGTTAEIMRLAGPATRRIEVDGRVVVPGFNDAHDHLGCHIMRPSVRVATTGTAMPNPPFALVADSLRAAAGRVAEGTWLLVSVGAAVLDDTAARRDALDGIAPRHPVQLQAWPGHDAIMNSAGLRVVGIPEDSADPPGGRYEREPGSGRLTGRLEEYAVWRAWSRLCGMQPETALVRTLQARGARMLRLGITSTQSMSNQLEADLMLRVLAAAALPQRVRIVAMPLVSPHSPALEWGGALTQARAATAGASGGFIVSGIKWIIDGSPVERGAAQRTAYRDRPGEFGRINFPTQEVRALLMYARELGQQPLFHVVGDSAIALVLNALDATGGASIWRDARVRLEHGDGLADDQFDRARRLGVIVVQNPTHLDLGGLLGERYDSSFLASFQPLRSLAEAGIALALGGDGTFNPFLNIMAAITHAHRPAEALTREQAVIAYTRGSAFAESAEHEKGTLAPGMLADLAVLSHDIFTVPVAVLPATTSVLTIIGGRVVWDELTAGVAGPPRPGDDSRPWGQ